MILQREVKFPQSDSFFLFGARGTGKSTLLRHSFPKALHFDLLEANLEREFSLSPGVLSAKLEMASNTGIVIVDEIQRVPALLNEIHRCMEGKFRNTQFILTGSSARKLKTGGANLLGGRAVLRSLYPFSYGELKNEFASPEAFLNMALSFGTLPRVWLSESNETRIDRLEGYVHAYLKEEVWAEQIVRKLEPFRRFLEVSAQQNSKIVNTASISRDVGADPKTVQNYFQILEDTLLGFQLDAFHTSVRKRLRQAPKFYFFDTGVTRALARQLRVPLLESTSAYGELFETFLINEIFKKNVYEKLDYKLSYLMTASNVEIDLVLERPGKPLALVEIKSTNNLREDHLKNIQSIGADFPEAQLYCFSRDVSPKKFGNVICLPWDKGLLEL